jgi:hypothetical protein
LAERQKLLVLKAIDLLLIGITNPVTGCFTLEINHNSLKNDKNKTHLPELLQRG